jgi:hypothetical protein
VSRKHRHRQIVSIPPHRAARFRPPLRLPAKPSQWASPTPARAHTAMSGMDHAAAKYIAACGRRGARGTAGRGGGKWRWTDGVNQSDLTFRQPALACGPGGRRTRNAPFCQTKRRGARMRVSGARPGAAQGGGTDTVAATGDASAWAIARERRSPSVSRSGCPRMRAAGGDRASTRDGLSSAAQLRASPSRGETGKAFVASV